jgi:Cu/Ag efflux pump CusA
MPHDHQHQDHSHHDAHDHHDHAHGHSHAPKDFGRAFLFGIILNTGFVIAETIYGILGNSLALLADAGHNLSDVLGLLLAFVLLYTAFNSVKYAALIITNVPFAIIGGVFGLWISGQYLSVPSAIGFIAVFGVAMLNGIVLVSFINELRAKGLPVAEAVRRGCELRLRPVLMTASVAILGLVPMLLSSGVGAETQRPLATVVIGGLITSTLLTLILLPVIYEWLETRKENAR